MPVYELVCLAKPALQKQVLSTMMQRVGQVVMDKGGVLTDVTSYGEQFLAYDIRRPFERHEKAHIWQMSFMLGPHLKRDVDHVLRVNKDVLRWVMVKRPDQFALSAMQTVRKSPKRPATSAPTEAPAAPPPQQ